MHELGIVMHVIKTVEDVARENEVGKVTKIRFEVGEVSSVVPQLFTDAFDWAKKKSEFLDECELELIVVEGISYCRACGNTYQTTKYAKICPHCGSPDTYLVSGDEITIRDIEAV